MPRLEFSSASVPTQRGQPTCTALDLLEALHGMGPDVAKAQHVPKCPLVRKRIDVLIPTISRSKIISFLVDERKGLIMTNVPLMTSSYT